MEKPQRETGKRYKMSQRCEGTIKKKGGRSGAERAEEWQDQQSIERGGV